jgi:pimeloyl-ACP methyl ester carboxylesterase
MPIAKVNGININYMVAGQGEPLVMIAGFSADQSLWKSQIPAFKKQFQVVIFDNRGVGKSDKPKGPYSLRMMSEDTIKLMDFLNIKKAHILGHSMGGLIAQEIAINYPERVMKLILASTWSYQDNDANGVTSAMLEMPQLPIRQAGVLMVDAIMNKRFNRWFVVPALKNYWRRIKEPDAIGIKAQLDGQMGYNSLDKLLSIKAQTLVLTGTKDRVIKPTSSETIAKNIPNARLVKIDKGSHADFIEMSKVFNQEVLNFLKIG